jgi:hypothetical protein
MALTIPVYPVQPEQPTGHIRIAKQISSVLREHKRAIVFPINQRAVINRVSLNVVIRKELLITSTDTTTLRSHLS